MEDSQEVKVLVFLSLALLPRVALLEDEVVKDGDPGVSAFLFQTLLRPRVEVEVEVVVFHFLACPPLGVLREALLESLSRVPVLHLAEAAEASDFQVCRRVGVLRAGSEVSGLRAPPLCKARGDPSSS